MYNAVVGSDEPLAVVYLLHTFAAKDTCYFRQALLLESTYLLIAC